MIIDRYDRIAVLALAIRNLTFEPGRNCFASMKAANELAESIHLLAGMSDRFIEVNIGHFDKDKVRAEKINMVEDSDE